MGNFPDFGLTSEPEFLEIFLKLISKFLKKKKIIFLLHLKENSMPVTEFEFDWVSELTKLSQYWSCCPEQYTELSHPDHRRENIEFDINL